MSKSELSDQSALGRLGQLLPTALVVARPDGTIAELNPAALSLLNAEPGARLHDRVTENADTVDRLLRMAAGSGQFVPGKLTIRGEGEDREFRISGARLNLDPGVPAFVVLTFESVDSDHQHRQFRSLSQSVEALTREVHARRRAEALLQAQKRVLTSIVSGEPLRDALSNLCLDVEAHTDGMLVSILLLEDRILRHAASPSLPADYSAAIDGVEIGPRVGSCGTAAHFAKQVIVTDIANDPLWSEFAQLAGEAGLAACWSTPIISSSQSVLGTLALYYKTPRAPTQSELKLIDDSTLVAALAIERHQIRVREQALLERTRRERERAKEENRAKDLFLAVLSHELRNPLSAISNAANVLATQDQQNAENSRQLHQVVVNETRQLKRILDDLLDISRLSQGKFKLQMAPLSVAEFFEEFRCATEAAHPDRPFQFQTTGDPGWMQGDRARLRQSLQNLVDNAIKYSDPESMVRVSLNAHPDHIELSVHDEGEGIRPELQPRIFEAFVQSDESLERGRSGLGLGLALVRRFIEMLGGEIRVETEVGKGSRFTLQLPRGEVAEHDENRESEPRPTGPCRVLVVEDNADARLGLCQLLEIWGHQVCSAGDGAEALDVMRSSTPDIALVDIGLPKLNGYQLAEAVREDPALSEIKLIALTGYGQESDRLRARKAGFDDHIVKPADPADLIRILGEPQVPA